MSETAAKTNTPADTKKADVTPETKEATVTATEAVNPAAFAAGVSYKVTNTSPGPRVFRVKQAGLVKNYALGPRKTVTAVIADPLNPCYAMWLKLGAITVAKA